MKTRLVAFGLIGILCTAAVMAAPAETDLYKMLLNGPESVKALEMVLKNPEEQNTLVLFTGAHVAFYEKRLEDSGFLFYAAQLRARFDKECFPPKGEDSNDPFVLFGALSEQEGSVINPAVMDQPKVFERALDRLKKWTPKAPKKYVPGYEFTERKSEKEAQEAAKPNRTDFIEHMSYLSTLLNDPDYFAAVHIVRAYNLNSDDKRPTKEANDKATETLKRIEKNKGIKFFSDLRHD